MACTALTRCLRLGAFLTIVPFKVHHNPKTGSYLCIFHRKIFIFSLLSIQIMSIVCILIFDWAGLYTQQTIRKIVYSLFNIHAVCGLITLWSRPKNFETVLSSIQEFQARAEGMGVVMQSEKKVRNNVLSSASNSAGRSI